MIRNISTPSHHLFLTDEYSQWYPSKFKDEKNRLFHCCEQWMMVRKAELFDDQATARKIMLATTPADCKALGREVKNFNPAVWDAHAPAIVLEGNMMKFSQNPDLWAVMEAAGDRVFVEAASYDKIWGIGLGAEAALATPPERWPLTGQNLLGKAVTKTSQSLRSRPDLIAPWGSWEDQRALAFNDERGQRVLRFTAREVAAALGQEPDSLAATLASMKNLPIAMDKPGFLKKGQLLSLPANELLLQLERLSEPKPSRGLKI